MNTQPIKPLPNPVDFRTPVHFIKTLIGIADGAHQFLTPTENLTFLEASQVFLTDALAAARRSFGSRQHTVGDCVESIRPEGVTAALAGLTTADLEDGFRNATDRIQIREHAGTNHVRRTPVPSKTLVEWRDGKPVVSTVPANA